ncbi:unnamed protein product [Cuscuta campestris]|uniref:Uncharacterized protein n=1 Tax=Cuscuta campestris TaxID=132261 RepID=A0A484M228_9ASTE|nr:unnamed protein product [Cuscuta campestris]
MRLSKPRLTKYVASYILRCCALDRTPSLDKFLTLFSIGGAFPFYSVFPHPKLPVFEKVEAKIDRWARRYFIIEFLVHSPIDLPGILRHSSLSRTPFPAAPEAEGVHNAPERGGGLISHHSLQDPKLYKKADFYYPLCPDPIPFEGTSSPGRSKASPSVESHPVEDTSRIQVQGGDTALVICTPSAALDVGPISAISMAEEAHAVPKTASGRGMEKEVGGQKEPKGAAFRCSALDLQSPHPVQIHTGNFSCLLGGLDRFSRGLNSLKASHSTIQVNLEKMRGLMQDPIIAQACLDPLALDVIHSMEQAQQSLLTLSEEYLGGAWGNYRAMVVLKNKEY